MALEAGLVVVLVPAEPVRVLAAAVQAPAAAQVVLAEVAGLGAQGDPAVEVWQAEEALWALSVPAKVKARQENG